MLNLLRVDDLLKGGVYHTVSATIESIIPPQTLKTEAGLLIDKPALKFVGKEKLLLLGETNIRLLHYATGDQLGQESIGKVIKLQPRVINAFKRKVLAIRIIPHCPVPKGLLDGLGRSANQTPTK